MGDLWPCIAFLSPLNSVQSNFDPPPDFYALKFCIPPDSYALKFVPLQLLCNEILSLFDYYALKFYPFLIIMH